MKVFSSISIIAAFLVAGSTASKTKEPTDWSKVSSKLEEMEKLVTETSKKLIITAKKDNETIGLEIERLILDEKVGVQTILEKTRGEINSKSLTAYKVHQYDEEFSQVYLRVMGRIMDLLSKRSDSVQKNVVLIISTAVDQQTDLLLDMAKLCAV